MNGRTKRQAAEKAHRRFADENDQDMGRYNEVGCSSRSDGLLLPVCKRRGLRQHLRRHHYAAVPWHTVRAS